MQIIVSAECTVIVGGIFDKPDQSGAEDAGNADLLLAPSRK